MMFIFLFLTGERGGEGEMYGKSNMETYITMCKIDSQQEFAVWLRKLPPVSLPIPPLYVDTEPLFEFPEPHSKFLLAIYFTHGNVSFHVTLSIQLALSSRLPMFRSILYVCFCIAAL